jgi:hypothetical protein
VEGPSTSAESHRQAPAGADKGQPGEVALRDCELRVNFLSDSSAAKALAFRIKSQVDKSNAVKAVVLNAREPTYYRQVGSPNGNELHYGQPSAQSAAAQLETLLHQALPAQHFTVIQAKEPEPTVLTILLPADPPR